MTTPSFGKTVMGLKMGASVQPSKRLTPMDFYPICKKLRFAMAFLTTVNESSSELL